ncbi:class I SAM-dependent methyltransferase [Dolichospermum compactum]|uniref:Type 11 methyltransferase n=1 Tax=Dolichospermum compactum NIES-806 TaxID=1973481 RepID=A0A1Z4V9E6_9CYAN|nr:class I SAM-dependent methyltransferase [Dolichospermum compactum]BAZ87855.1 hypothetical protein NIES806_40870 [Dolichospermum compactum NIES-806]
MVILSEQQCPSCGGQGSTIGISFDEDVLHCQDCDLCFLKNSVRPMSANDNGWYSELFDFSQNAANNLVAEMQDSYLRQLSTLEKVSHGRNILDVGCGIGIFLAVAKSRDWNVFGVESSEHGAYFANKHFDIQYQSSIDEFPANTFDVVRISHVLEHIPEPRDFLHQLYRVLKPSGILVVIVPNREPLCAMFVNRYRQLFSKKPKLAGAIYPDMHVLGFSTKSLNKLVNSIKFNTVSCFTVSMGDITYYPLFYDGLLSRTKITNIKFKTFLRYYLPMIVDNLGNPFSKGQWIVGYFAKNE